MPFKSPNENPAPFDSPKAFGLKFEDVYLTAQDGVKLHGWFVPALDRDHTVAATIVFFHGNAMNIGFRLPNVSLLCEQLGVNGERSIMGRSAECLLCPWCVCPWRVCATVWL